VSGFIAGGIVSDKGEYDEKTGVLVVTARLSLTLPTPPDARTTQAFERLSRLSFKIGLSLEDTQQIEEFTAGGNAAEETPAVAADLTGVFGSLPGRRWIGLTFKSPPPYETIQPNVVTYHLRLRLRGVHHLPQLIPAPSRYGNAGSFAESYLSALWVIERR
jgi:hypothetical protein